MKTTRSLKNVLFLLLTTLLFAAAPSCMYSHEDGDLINPHGNQFFAGYAEFPQAPIVLEAFNRSTNNWDFMGYTYASTTPTTINGVSLYNWGYSVVLADLPNYACYASPHCYIPAGDHSIKLRFKEVGGTLSFLKTFDQGGLECVIQRIVAGDDMITAGAICGQNSPEITLKVIG